MEIIGWRVFFLCRKGSQGHFSVPERTCIFIYLSILMIPYSDILTRSTVTTASGRTYHLSMTDQTRASEAVSNYIRFFSYRMFLKISLNVRNENLTSHNCRLGLQKNS